MTCRLNENPEPSPLAQIYIIAVGVSVISCLVFAVVICYNRLLRTALMKQVFFLCISDLLVYCWEIAWCPSLVHVYACLDRMTCTLYYPILRVLQMASVLWITHISVCVALVVSVQPIVPCVGFVSVSFEALLLCSPALVAGLTSGYVPVEPGVDYPCRSTWFIHPDTIWTIEVGVLLSIAIGSYIYTLRRICKLSTAAAVTAKLYRVLIYVAVFCICYAPYVVLQGLKGAPDLARLAKSSPGYQIMYLCYLLAGACNVAAYGIHHWDAACWRRRGRGRVVNGNEGRVVTFLPNTQCTPSSMTSTTDEESDHRGTTSMSTDSPALTTSVGISCRQWSSTLLSAPPEETPEETPEAEGVQDGQVEDNPAFVQDVMDAAKAYGCF